MPLKILSLGKRSVLRKHGIEPGDTIVSINKRRIYDYFGVLHELERKSMEFMVSKKGGYEVKFRIERADYPRMECEFGEMKMMKCANKCIFCFIDQNPPAMRKTLYFKDDDYRESLTCGNFITLSNLSREMLDNMAEHRLSPIYVSLHSSENRLRERVFGRKNPVDSIEYLAKRGVRMHFQIVLMKGINDGAHLKKTLSFAKGIKALSVGIVPVGLTSHREGLFHLEPFDSADSRRAIAAVEEWKAKNSFRRVYMADEFFLKAGIGVPEKRYYGSYPQIENGIGMVSLFLEETKGLQKKRLKKNRAIVTGVSFGRYLTENGIFGGERIYAAKNNLMGENVTVTGLLSGKDILFCLKNVEESDIIIHKSIFNSDGKTLDGYDLKGLCRESKKRLTVLFEYKDIKEHLI